MSVEIQLLKQIVAKLDHMCQLMQQNQRTDRYPVYPGDSGRAISPNLGPTITTNGCVCPIGAEVNCGSGLCPRRAISSYAAQSMAPMPGTDLT